MIYFIRGIICSQFYCIIKFNIIVNNDLTIGMLDIPGLASESLLLLELLHRTQEFLFSTWTSRTDGQEEQLVDDWYEFYTILVNIKHVLVAQPYQTRAIKKALSNVDNYIIIAEGCARTLADNIS